MAYRSEHIIDDIQRGVFRVRRDAFTDPAVLELERTKIFHESWLYVGHESEIAENGSFVTREVGGRPIIMVRDRQGAVRVFLNACAHRGNMVCREKSGKAARFTCFYHAWSFDLTGRLMSVPQVDAYGPQFNKADLPLSTPAGVEVYRGLVFLRYAEEGPALTTFLGNAREHLDHFLDIANDDFEIVPGAQTYSMRANWKLLIENSVDMYHAFVTHRRYFDQFAGENGLGQADAIIKPVRDISAGRPHALDNGHSLIEYPVPDLPVKSAAGEGLAKERASLVAIYGEDRASELLDVARNLFIFPNLVLVSNWRTIRTFYPLAPDYMEVESWALLPRNESPETRRARLSNYISFLGPAGFGTPDDVEALEGCQRGFRATPDGWSDISRGMSFQSQIPSDELQMRNFWRRWRTLVEGVEPSNELEPAVVESAK